LLITLTLDGQGMHQHSWRWHTTQFDSIQHLQACHSSEHSNSRLALVLMWATTQQAASWLRGHTAADKCAAHITAAADKLRLWLASSAPIDHAYSE
jgi:hypothetical protein